MAEGNEMNKIQANRINYPQIEFYTVIEMVIEMATKILKPSFGSIKSQ